MAWFNFKKKNKYVPDDATRELAYQTRLQNKSLRDQQILLQKLQVKRDMAIIQEEIDEIQGTDDEENILGIGQEEMALIGILQKFGIMPNIGAPQTQVEETITPPTDENGKTSSSPALLRKMPKAVLNQLKKIPKEDLHKYIDQL